ncbi:glycosyl hydrolase-related protein [Bifidobacterium sp. ESL0775]|uniref:alpha-mannosidase n=1 Tax=Bifidobacterium sp. ESL0775 TaxID=2983230 RepID=UPI0023F6574A|nr:glycoside hydrolase family 38 C-terminal domain-containing protein [Bifidobacterium sp. ESL0775]WEV69807.1 glycosyl hydrolase-related protein [Bifidobacterium sp. ESL0775]
MTTTTENEKTMQRAERVLREYLPDALYRNTEPVSIEAWKVGGEPVDFKTAKAATYQPFNIGDTWGAPWDTWWIHVSGTVPASWVDEGTQPELVVDLGKIGRGPGFQAEGLVRDADGTVIKAVEPYNDRVPLPAPGQSFEFYIEAAANPQIGQGGRHTPTEMGNEGVQDGPELYRLMRLEMGQLDLEVWNLIQELQVLCGLSNELDSTRTRHAEIMAAISDSLDAIDIADVKDSAKDARKALVDVLASPAVNDGHTVYAIGHAHIDSAWLWPLRETKRKVARTFSNAVELGDEDPDYIFAASSAQQYQWLKQNYPGVFKEVQRKVREGQFIPVGGMWVESDAMLTGGESLVRQFVQGMKFFNENTGGAAPIVWLPDSFGYSGAFPQIARLAGIQYFLTQKISWNDTNVFPHHSFLWQGIDGTEIFTHFPPSDTYNAHISPAEVALSERQYSEKGNGGKSSLMLFGWGDGGGGPTREMMAAARLQSNLEGSPKVKVASPIEFFDNASSEIREMPRWNGELYLEKHRGTGTSESNTKQGNRRCEALLREAEMWATYATVETGVAYPYDKLQDIWQKVLLYQFHDILPGSAIAWVYAEVERSQRQLISELNDIIHEAIVSLCGEGNLELKANAGPLPQEGIASTAIDEPHLDGRISVHGEINGIVLENDAVSYTLDEQGRIISAFDKRAGRETIDSELPGNDLQLFGDAPSHYDAWDIEKSYQRMRVERARKVSSCRIVEQSVEVSGTIGSSGYSQKLALDNDTNMLRIHTHVDWRESDKLLKQAFPVNLYAKQASCEIQYGHLDRPIIKNTSWDEAKFESSAQRWVHVADGDFGVSVANASSYAYDFEQVRLSNGRPGTLIRASLLRATHYPTPRADVGEHDFDIAFGIGTTLGDAIRAGYRMNVPARLVKVDHGVPPFLSLDNSNVLLEAVKMAEDQSGDVVVRLYEASGTSSHAHLSTGFPYQEVREVGLLESECDAVQNAVTEQDGSVIGLSLHPFQIVTLRFCRK